MSHEMRPGTPPDEAEVERLYRESAIEEPPAALDAEIRAAARREVAYGPRRASGPFGRSWTVPASIAAVLALGVGLVSVMQQRAPELAAPPAPASLQTHSDELGAALDKRLAEFSERHAERVANAPKPVHDLALADAAEGFSAGSMEQRAEEPERREALRSAPTPESEALAEADNAATIESAESQLQRIRHLLDKSRDVEALEVWKAFRASFPAYPVEQELLDEIDAIDADEEPR